MSLSCKADNLKKATFAGGCFWCMEPPYSQLGGVVSVTPGYTGGTAGTATYERVSMGGTGHYEAIQIEYDPDKVSYKTLLDIYWKQIDPTDAGGQFADRGSQYRTVIFYHDQNQKEIAEASKRELAESGKFRSEIATQILPAEEFYPAEEYHREYYLKNPDSYKRYKKGSGRAGYIEDTWGTH